MKAFAPEQGSLPSPLTGIERCKKWILRILSAYGLYLLLLGPFWSMDGRGFLDFIPTAIRETVYLPCLIFRGNLLGRLYVGYLDLWYVDPNAAETTG